MKKIRINELARELEVKPGVIIDMLPELGVHEKKTHSSSIDEDVALILRQRLTGFGGPSEESPETSNGHIHEALADAQETHSAAPLAERIVPPVSTPAATPAQPARAESALASPETTPPAAVPAGAAIAAPGPPAQSASAEAQPASAEPERVIPKFQPLRPPLGSGGAIHPPLAHPPPMSAEQARSSAISPEQARTPGSTPVNRNISIPARPLPQSSPRLGALTPATTPVGPRQPLPSEARPGPGMAAPPRQPRLAPTDEISARQPAGTTPTGASRRRLNRDRRSPPRMWSRLDQEDLPLRPRVLQERPFPRVPRLLVLA